jgi:predicted nucleic acid-binding protein
MLDVRTGSTGGATSVSVIGKGTVQLATGRAGSGNVVATSGIRGLDEESLGKAEADAAQLAKLKTLAASESVARNYAKRVGLKARTVAALPAPGGQE